MGSKDIVVLAHGGGGSLTKELIEDLILKHLGNPLLEELDDAACLHVAGSELVFTTDSYVVDPLFFPGGDIGMLSICGTINDLAMQGGEPKFLSLALILEEGFPLADLDRILASMGKIVKETGVPIVTGDTKVVQRGRGNGVFINTSGIGVRSPGIDVHVANAMPGDVVIISGTVGDHGIAVMSKREGLEFDVAIVSDVAPLWSMIQPLLNAVPDTRALRDPTRGGLTAALCDVARASQTAVMVDETAIPVRKEVMGACKLLGLDPLEVANEGKALVVCPPEKAQLALKTLKACPLGAEARIIGSIAEKPEGMALLKTRIGGERILDLPTGENLPRIC